MKKMILAGAMFLGMAGNGFAGELFTPFMDLKEEAVATQKEGKVVMVMFYMEHCPACKYMFANALVNDEVKNFYSKNFNSYQVDVLSSLEVGDFKGVSKPQKVISVEQRVPGTPTFGFYDGNGKLIYKSTGSKNAKGFLSLGKYVSEGFYKKMTFDEYQKMPIQKTTSKPCGINKG